MDRESGDVGSALVVRRRAHQFGPGRRAVLTWAPEGASGPSWGIRAEVLTNAVWRRGRLFFRCGHCQRRATRLYVPVAGLEPRCWRCWGISYESQSWNYKPTGFLGALFGPVAYVTTIVRREERQEAARARCGARRAFLRAAKLPISTYSCLVPAALDARGAFAGWHSRGPKLESAQAITRQQLEFFFDLPARDSLGAAVQANRHHRLPNASISACTLSAWSIKACSRWAFAHFCSASNFLMQSNESISNPRVLAKSSKCSKKSIGSCE